MKLPSLCTGCIVLFMFRLRTQGRWAGNSLRAIPRPEWEPGRVNSRQHNILVARTLASAEPQCSTTRSRQTHKPSTSSSRASHHRRRWSPPRRDHPKPMIMQVLPYRLFLTYRLILDLINPAKAPSPKYSESWKTPKTSKERTSARST